MVRDCSLSMKHSVVLLQTKGMFKPSKWSYVLAHTISSFLKLVKLTVINPSLMLCSTTLEYIEYK